MSRARVRAFMAAALLLALHGPARAATVEYIHTDALGTPVAVTNAAGQVIERREYEPYGKTIVGGPGTMAPKDGPGYTGHVFDAATGLVYMQARYYDDDLGRFLSVDPVTADGNSGSNFNRYKYANNNPYRFTDPDGREERDMRSLCGRHPSSCPKGQSSAPNGLGSGSSRVAVAPRSGSETGNSPRAAGPGSVFESRNQAQGEAEAYVTDSNGGPIRSLFGGQMYLINTIELDSPNAFTYTLTPVQTGMPPAVGLRGAGLGSTIFKTAHYAARLEAAGLNVGRTQTIIAREIARVRNNMTVGADVVGRMRVNGVMIEYRMQALPNGSVNVGSIFPVR